MAVSAERQRSNSETNRNRTPSDEITPLHRRIFRRRARPQLPYRIGTGRTPRRLPTSLTEVAAPALRRISREESRQKSGDPSLRRFRPEASNSPHLDSDDLHASRRVRPRARKRRCMARIDGSSLQFAPSWFTPARKQPMRRHPTPAACRMPAAEMTGRTVEACRRPGMLCTWERLLGFKDFVGRLQHDPLHRPQVDKPTHPSIYKWRPIPRDHARSLSPTTLNVTVMIVRQVVSGAGNRGTENSHNEPDISAELKCCYPC